jgi:hypothetical protein
LSRFVFSSSHSHVVLYVAVIMDLLLLFSWPLMLRPHHLRALAILVTLVSLSLLFSTFSMRSGENRMWMMDPAGRQQQYTGGRVVMSAVDPTASSAASEAALSKGPITLEEETSSSSSSASFTLTTASSARPSSKSNYKFGVGEVYQITRKSLKPRNPAAAVVKVICCSHFFNEEFLTITIGMINLRRTKSNLMDSFCR